MSRLQTGKPDSASEHVPTGRIRQTKVVSAMPRWASERGDSGQGRITNIAALLASLGKPGRLRPFEEGKRVHSVKRLRISRVVNIRTGVRREKSYGNPYGVEEKGIFPSNHREQKSANGGSPDKGEGRGDAVQHDLRSFLPRFVARQTLERVQVGGHLSVIMQNGTFITVIDRDRTLYEVRELQYPPHVDPAQARARPVLLLGSGSEVTDFVGREPEKARLQQWYDSPDPVSVILIHGAAGQGKTRLMREFARIVRERDERPEVYEAFSVTVASALDTAIEESEAAGNSAAPTGILLLVDDADTWPRTKLLSLLRDAVASGSGRVRVILTARADGPWWAGLHSRDFQSEITFDALHLGPLSAADMRKLADAAARCFAGALAWPQPPLSPNALARLAGGPPLSVELMILARVNAHNSGQRIPGGLREAVAVILQKELQYWERMYGMEGPDDSGDLYRIRIHPDSMRRVVYIATLTGELELGEALHVMELARTGCGIEPQTILDDHARCYPPTDDHLRLASLPACVAEEFLGMLVPGGQETAIVKGDTWATGVPFHILGLLAPEEREAESTRLRRAAEARIEVPPETSRYNAKITFAPRLDRTILNLVRAASAHPHVASNQLYPLALHYPKTVVMAGITALTELKKIRPAPSGDVLRALEEAATECDPENLADYQAAINELQRRAKRGNHPRRGREPDDSQ